MSVVPSQYSRPAFLWLIMILQAPSGAQYSPDSRGREFIISFMENEANHGSNWKYVDLFISTASITKVSVNVTTPRLSVGKINEKLNVTFGKVEHLKLGYNVINEGSTRSSKGLHITATDEVIVFSMNKQDTSTDGYLAFPIDVLGNTHYAVCYSFDSNKVFTSNMVVVGIEDNTELSIKLSIHHKINIRVEGKTYRYGEWINLTLNAYDTLQLETIGDLTGSLIHGDKPIAVFTGNKKTNIYLSGGRGDRGRDHLVEQIPPTVTWGKHFATVPFPERSDGYILRFVTSEGHTSISIAGCVTKTLILNTGTFRQENIPDSSCFLTINSSKPILIAQFSKSSDGKILSDPSMFIVPPIEQYAADYIISSPPATHSAFSNYFMVIIKASEKDGLIVDGKNIQSVRASFKSIHGTDLVGGYVYVGKDLKAHSIKHKSPTSVFGAVAYGGAHYESYAFPVGLRLAPINQVCKASQMTIADGLDNDCDQLIDEEICNGKDEDGDLHIDEDCAATDPTFTSTTEQTSVSAKPATSSSKTKTSVVTSKDHHHHSKVSSISTNHHFPTGHSTDEKANKYSLGKQLLPESTETRNGEKGMLPNWFQSLEAGLLSIISCVIFGLSLCVCKNIFGIVGRRNRDDEEEKGITAWQKKKRPLPVHRYQ